MGNFKVFLLMAALTALFVVVGGSIGGREGMLIAFVLAATMIQFAISRTREFKADATAAAITGKPLDLAEAPAKINAAAKQIPMRIPATMAPLAQVDPLQAFGGGVGRLFSTHPPVEERIARLQAMAAGQMPAA